MKISQDGGVNSALIGRSVTILTLSNEPGPLSRQACFIRGRWQCPRCPEKNADRCPDISRPQGPPMVGPFVYLSQAGQWPHRRPTCWSSCPSCSVRRGRMRSEGQDGWGVLSVEGRWLCSFRYPARPGIIANKADFTVRDRIRRGQESPVIGHTRQTRHPKPGSPHPSCAAGPNYPNCLQPAPARPDPRQSSWQLKVPRTGLQQMCATG